MGIPQDEAVSRELPFGLETTPQSLDVSSDLMHIKNLLTAQKGLAEFKSTCEFLGGKAPQEIVFTTQGNNPNSNQPAPSERSTASLVVQ